jgi:hypothetical protein
MGQGLDDILLSKIPMANLRSSAQTFAESMFHAMQAEIL